MDPLIRRQLERVFKGVANHRRIEILQLLQAQPKLTLWQIQDRARLGRQTACEHVRRLTLARLVHKRYRGREVEHTLAPLGHKILSQLPLFLST